MLQVFINRNALTVTLVHLFQAARRVRKLNCIILFIKLSPSTVTKRRSSPRQSENALAQLTAEVDVQGVRSLVTRLGPPDNWNKVRKVRLKLPCILLSLPKSKFSVESVQPVTQTNQQVWKPGMTGATAKSQDAIAHCNGYC